MTSFISRLYASLTGQPSSVDDTVLEINVGGRAFTTKVSTLKQAPGGSRFDVIVDQLVAENRLGQMPGWLKPATRLSQRRKSSARRRQSRTFEDVELAFDSEGRLFLDRDPDHFKLILKYLRDPACVNVPDLPKSELIDLWEECQYFGLDELADLVDERMDEQTVAASAWMQSLLEDPNLKSVNDQVRNKEKMQVLERRMHLEQDKRKLERKNKGKKLKYNLLVVGVTGTGKSSSLNTLVDKQLCQVSGGQAQGTRGCVLQEGAQLDDHFISFIDTQGLGADTSISDVDLLRNIMISTESVMKMGIINNVLISFDMSSRMTPATMANQMTLVELFRELKRSCFLVFTKWNSSSVQMEWNHPLRNWVKKWRKAKRVRDIKEDPPAYQTMYQAYCAYVIDSMANEQDGGAFSKLSSFLAFFDARVLWMYNLDAAQLEDRENGDLPPYEEKLYSFYRNLCLDRLEAGTTKIDTNELTFLQHDHKTMLKIAAELVQQRDEKITKLELSALDPSSLSKYKDLFLSMADDTARRIGMNDFSEVLFFSTKIAQVAGIVNTVYSIGCSVQ